MASSKQMKKIAAACPREAFENVAHCEPLISADEMYALEAELDMDGLRRVRHVGLMLATRDGAWFERLSSNLELAQAISADFEALGKTAKLLKHAADLLEQARRRSEAAIFEGFTASVLLGPLGDDA